MEIRQVATAELIPYEKNPRRNDKAVDAVKKSISKYGFKVPIVIDNNNVIVAGHTRYKAAQKLRLKKVPCIIADDLTEEQVKAFRLADNKTGELATWDMTKLSMELNSLSGSLAADFSFELPQAEPVQESFCGEDLRPTKANREYETMIFTFTNEQKVFVKAALDKASVDVKETFGNSNQWGNALYEIARQWAERNGISDEKS